VEWRKSKSLDDDFKNGYGLFSYGKLCYQKIIYV